MQAAGAEPPLWLCLLVCISSGSIYGYHSGVIGPALAHRSCSAHKAGPGTALFPVAELLGCGDDDCSSDVISLMSATFIVGAMVANLSGSSIARVVGLRVLLLSSGVISIFGAAGTLLSTGKISFVCWRAVAGVGVGLLSFGVPFWVSEFAPAASRGRIMGYFPLAIVGGIFVVYLYGLGMSYGLCDSSRHGGGKALQWRLLYGGVLIPSVIYLCAITYEIFGRSKRNVDGPMLADKTPPLLAESAPNDGEDSNPERDTEAADPAASASTSASASAPPLLCGGMMGAYSWVGFAFGIAACQQLTGINALISYTPGIFQDAGASNSLVAAAATNGMNVLATLLSGIFVDRIGRRPLLLGALTLMTVALVGVALMFVCIDATSGILCDILRIFMILFLMAYFAGFALGPGPLFYLICAETFNAEVRDRAMMTANFFLWTFNLITVTTFPFLYDAIGEAPTFFLCGFISLCCCVFAAFSVRETKNAVFRRSTSVHT